jgi:hypothetical protein
MTEAECCAQWARKIAAIAQACPNPPCTGIHKDQADEYPYTRAQEIFSTYHKLMHERRIVIVPGQMRTFMDTRAYRVECEWHIIDADTGYSMSQWSSGLGNNGIWSLQSAITVAKKQLLLMLFMAEWPCEFDVSLETMGVLSSASLWDGYSAREAKKLLTDFFDQVHADYQALTKRIDAAMKTKG